MIGGLESETSDTTLAVAALEKKRARSENQGALAVPGVMRDPSRGFGWQAQGTSFHGIAEQPRLMGPGRSSGPTYHGKVSLGYLLSCPVPS